MNNSSSLTSGGIYVIRNTVSGKIYVGSTKQFKSRWRDHRRRLRKGNHENKRLIAAWQKHGEEAFVFEVLEVIPSLLLGDFKYVLSREQFWFDKLSPFGKKGYNIVETAGGCVPITPEIREKLRAANLGKVLLDRRKKYIVTDPKGDEYLVHGLVEFCKQINVDYSQLVAVARGKRATCKGWKCRYADPAIAAKYEREFRDNYRIWIVTTPTGEEIRTDNLEQFCRDYGVYVSRLRDIAKGRRIQYKGWKCRYADPEWAEKHPPKQRSESAKKAYVAVSPDGVEHQVFGMRGFCKDHGLCSPAMFQVLAGKRAHHKGWKCRYADESEAS